MASGSLLYDPIGTGPRGSVITRVTPIAIDTLLFVEVETRDGNVGAGEASSWAHLEATEAAIGKFGAYLVGQSACDIAHNWEVMLRFGSYSGSVIMAAIPAIDIALWDIKGQRLGAPIVDLLGGRFRDRARVYGQARGASRGEPVAQCIALKAAGFTAIGHVNPVLDGAETQEQNRSDCQRLDDAVATTDHIAGELVTATPVQQDGHVRLGDAPGLGAALRDGAIRRQPVRPIRVGMKLRADGSPMEH
ncbi:hypothetical protein [Arenibacterium halophilum]|uniref:Mandelate racemase/muconate lactonizing enzyme N-terminal domain-containing protein n=1 Tax=Arenibacterium halophilum TaxID=2583821 RepID=A0ABY2WY45_9RHOB|nr:hypothetical protein [Arenibacterium halophilum]TMV07376.1 hypothetical protein FGK64_21855 [Arenibacterium halophilum]